MDHWRDCLAICQSSHRSFSLTISSIYDNNILSKYKKMRFEDPLFSLLQTRRTPTHTQKNKREKTQLHTSKSPFGTISAPLEVFNTLNSTLQTRRTPPPWGTEFPIEVPSDFFSNQQKICAMTLTCWHAVLIPHSNRSVTGWQHWTPRICAAYRSFLCV